MQGGSRQSGSVLQSRKIAFLLHPSHETPGEKKPKPVLLNRAGFEPVCEWQRKGCRKVDVERASCGSAPVVPGGYQGGESSCWQWDAKAISLQPHTGTTSGTVPLRWLRWLRAGYPIPRSLSPAGSRGAWQSTARAARLYL